VAPEQSKFRVDGVKHNVGVADFQESANSEGEHGRVITAVSYNSGQVTYLSCGWRNDTSTVYETQVSTVIISTAVHAAQNLQPVMNSCAYPWIRAHIATVPTERRTGCRHLGRKSCTVAFLSGGRR
jgi:hypothetical protein